MHALKVRVSITKTNLLFFILIGIVDSFEISHINLEVTFNILFKMLYNFLRFELGPSPDCEILSLRIREFEVQRKLKRLFPSLFFLQEFLHGAFILISIGIITIN